jgi:hypothetical protein
LILAHGVKLNALNSKAPTGQIKSWHSARKMKTSSPVFLRMSHRTMAQYVQLLSL